MLKDSTDTQADELDASKTQRVFLWYTHDLQVCKKRIEGERVHFRL